MKHENKQFRRKKDKSKEADASKPRMALGSTYQMLRGNSGGIT